LVDTKTTLDFYIDGGFANNTLFINYLQKTFPEKYINTTGFNQATAYGAYLQLKQLLESDK
jgi:hypothetical protein